MNKINIYVLTFFLSLAGVSIYAQNNRSQVVITSGQDNNVFFHTIEKGQTVYAIATMYGVTPDDIYRLNPDSKEGIKAGATLKIPQRDIVGGTAKKQDGNYIFHTIQPKETLYSLSIRYTVPATAIVKANPGLSTSTFTIGKTIRIPATQVEDLPTTELKTVTKEIEYTVQKKETMYRICRKFNISSYELIKLNPKLKEGVKAGMTIKIPVQAEENMTTEPATTMLSERDVNALLSEPKSIERVNSVKVALLLPFMTNETIPSTETQRFIEYYEGLLLAVDSLKNTGCSIDLSVYDTGNGTKKLKEILKECQPHHRSRTKRPDRPGCGICPEEQHQICDSFYIEERRCVVKRICLPGKYAPLLPVCQSGSRRMRPICRRQYNPTEHQGRQG